MKKMFGKVPKTMLLAAATFILTAFTLTILAACSDGGDKESEPKVSKQYKADNGSELTLYDDDTFTYMANGKTSTGTYTETDGKIHAEFTGGDLAGKDLYATPSGGVIAVTVDGTITYFAQVATPDTPNASGSGDEVPVVAKLPVSVGTEPLATGTYTAVTGVSSSWWICFGEGKNQEVGGTKIGIDTAKNSITLLSYDKDDGHEETDALLKYAYDSTKKEIYLALSKLGYEKKDNGDTSYLWTRDEIVSYLQSIVGQTFDDKGDSYTYTQKDFEEDKAELDESFNVVVTYCYEKSESGIITLSLKEPIIYEGEETVTLTGMPKVVSAL